MAERPTTSLPEPPCCPYCAEPMRWAQAVDPEYSGPFPTAGSVSVCAECVEPSMFVDGPFGLGLRKPTAQEREWIMAHIGESTMKFKMMRARGDFES